MILHGKDLIVSIDGNAALASKSCTLDVSAKSMVKTSPTSGDWEECLAGKKSWSLTTNHLVKKENNGGGSGTPRFTAANLYFKNNITEGWEARGEGHQSTRWSYFDEFGDTYNITVLEIREMGSVAYTIHFDKDGKSIERIGGNYVTLYQYLNGQVQDHVPGDYSVIAIMTVGEFSIDATTCNLLSSMYHVALPCVEFGRRPTAGPVSYDTTPIIITGGKNLHHGFISLNSISNEVIFGITDAQVYTPEQGIPNNINMVGQKVSIRMTDNNGDVWAGQAEITQFKVTGTKGNLMAGSFSFKGNGELQTESRLDYEPTPVPEYMSRIVLDMKESNPANMIKGDINGTVFQEIMENTHRYLCKYRGNGEMSMCQLKDDDSNLFFNGAAATLDGTQGDVYVRLGGFYDIGERENVIYYKISDLGNKRYELAVSKQALQDFSTYYPERNLIAAFKAVGTQSYNDNVAVAAGGDYYLRSIVANRASMKDTIANVSNAIYRKMNDSYFGAVGPEEHALIAMLYFIKYGNPNCKAFCGNGASVETSAGVTVGMGMTDTNAPDGTATINLFGLENWWGGGTEIMERTTYGDEKIVIRTRDNEEIQVPISAANDATDPVIQNMLMQAEPLLILPSGEQPNSTDYTKYFCNAVSFGEMGFVLRGKGGNDGGITWIGLGTLGDVSARICYHGNTGIDEDPDNFLALIAVDPAN